jgi:methylenetetrahydrofolate dehydrogenase (NADP+) / methenyltetrahydrofolate cyclohydrolase
MTARIIDGKAIAADLRLRIAGEVARLKFAHGIVPGIAVVQVGNNPASDVYVRTKSKAVADAGMRAFDHKLPESVSEAELLALVAKLNADKQVNGILVQLPLPPQIDSQKVIGSIEPDKDVDGFHPLNAGRHVVGLAGLVPCTPLGCVLLAKTVHASLAGLEAVVIGRSNIVGKPVAQLLLTENATVTIAHSKTRDLAAVCRRADLLVAAIGRPEMVRGDWIKPGATVIDVGINRVAVEGGESRPAGGAGKYKIVGDVAFGEAEQVAGALTPVPGGVGPMTIACLLLNTLRATCAQNDLSPPAIGG